ncbi:MAG: hypothetical protein R3F37_17960 [Candidatus Competibacteraceae bacterium]
MIKKLVARICAFFQDRIDNIFDETTQGTTIRDIFEPLPSWLAQAIDYLQDNGKALEELNKKLGTINSNWNKEKARLQSKLDLRSRDQLSQNINEAWGLLLPFIVN